MIDLNWEDGPPPVPGLYYLLNELHDSYWTWTENVREKDLKPDFTGYHRLAHLKYAGPLPKMPAIPNLEQGAEFD